MFRSGMISVEDPKCLLYPSMSKTHKKCDKIRELINTKRYLTIHQLVNEVGISSGSCKSILAQNMNISWNTTP